MAKLIKIIIFYFHLKKISLLCHFEPKNVALLCFIYICVIKCHSSIKINKKLYKEWSKRQKERVRDKQKIRSTLAIKSLFSVLYGHIFMFKWNFKHFFFNNFRRLFVSHICFFFQFRIPISHRHHHRWFIILIKWTKQWKNK